MFQNYTIPFPYRASYIAAIVIICCTLPLYLTELPGYKSLLIISLLFTLLVALSVLKGVIMKKIFLLVYTAISLITFTHFIFQAQQYQENRLNYQYAKKQFLLNAKIIDFPKKTIKHEHLVVALTLRLNSNVVAEDGSIILRKNNVLKLTCYHCEKNFALAEVWQFQARLKPPRGTASWGAFDYEKYAFANQIVATGSISGVSAKKIMLQQSFIDLFRQTLHTKLNEMLLESQHGHEKKQEINKNIALLQALIVGDKGQLKAQHWKLFRETGTSHLMSISGLHITLVFFLMNTLIRMKLSLLFRLLPPILSRFLMEKCFHRISIQAFSMVCALFAASFYAFAAGLSLPTQRGILMLTVICVVRLFSKNISLFESLCVAITIILILSPLSTLHDGFWLSAIAVLIIVVLLKSRDTKWLLQMRMAIIMVFVTLLFFDQAPLVSPLANLLLIPMVAVIILPFTLLLMLLSFSMNFLLTDMLNMSSYLSTYLNLGWQFLNILLDCVWYLLDLFSRCQVWIYEHLSLSTPSSYVAVTLTVVCICLILVWRLAFARALLFIPFIAIFLIDPRENLRHGEFSVTTLDVGQGLAIVLETSSSYVVFDTGIAFSNSDSAERIIIPFFKQHRRKPLTAIIVSHADNDHIGGLNTLHKFSPKTPVFINQTDNFFGITQEKKPLSKRDMKMSICHAKEWQQDGVSFQIFPKVNLIKALKRNNKSCVMRVVGRYGSVLLPADIERETEHYLSKYLPRKIKADVLIAPHHGSRTSSTPVFLNAVNPDLVIISAAYFSQYGHPHPEVVDRLYKYSQEVRKTSHSGSIKIDFLKDGVQRREYRALHRRFWYSEHLN